MTEAADVVARLTAALRPGGLLVVEGIDVEGSFCHPESEAYRRYCALYCATARARGVDPYVGRRLPTLLAEAGCNDVGVAVAQPVGLRSYVDDEADVKLGSPLTMEAIAEAAVGAGLATQEEIARVVDDLYRLVEDDGTLMTLPRIVQA